MTRRRGRALSAEELRLWSEVARFVAPLAGRTQPALPPREAGPASAAPQGSPVVHLARALPPNPQPVRAALPPLAPVERRTARALSRGRRAPDAVLDLHGLTQGDAHGRLVGFLRRAQAGGLGLVMVITGQGRSEGFGGERGVLRRAVPLWLSLPELRPLVLGFEEAGPRQGGAGALVIRLRRGAARS